MEKIPAACAMEWSIELEKSLRSKKSSKSIEAVQKFGSNLEWWNSESKLSVAEYHLFGLIPGEDKLFANAILVRLADTFSSGDKQMKLCVVKLFLSEYKHGKRRRRNDGILSKNMFPNYLELLRKVKVVFETGDVEVRAMALALFGCWANFAHDSAEIRYLILSSVVSSEILEVKASLFAAGCFCELSDDFSCVLLEMLINMVSSSEIEKVTRIAGVRALSKLGDSFQLATKTYEAGLKLLSDSSEEDFIDSVLISLTKIATKSTLLITRQVEMLFSFLSQDKSFCLQATSLKCLRFMLAEGGHNVHDIPGAIKILLCRLNEPKTPADLRCDSLKILHKILLQNLFSFSYHDMLELLYELLTVDGIQSTTSFKRVSVIHVLVDIYGKFIKRAESELDGDKLHHLASQIITSIVDRTFLLVKAVPELQQVESQVEVEQEAKSFLNLLFHLVEEHKILAGRVLEKIIVSINFKGKGKAALSDNESELGENKRDTKKFMSYIVKVLQYCLGNVDKTGALSAEVPISMKLLLEDVHTCSLFDCYTHTVYSLLYWSHFTYPHLWNNLEETTNLKNKLGTADQNDFVRHGLLTLECSNKLLARKENWLAYKAGKYAACHGAWFVAAFIFRKLIKLVQSHSCVCWLKLLADFAHSEMQVQFPFLPKQGSDLLKKLLDSHGISTSIQSSSNLIDNLDDACKILHTSEEMLSSTSTSANGFSFQRWFLSLRTKFLENITGMLRILDAIGEAKSKNNSDQQIYEANMVENSQFSQSLNSFVHPLTQISLQFRRLAQESDLITASFYNMDCRSVMIISAVALSCSLLAFSVSFALFISLEKCEDSLYPMLILDLLDRLWHVDRETCAKLMLLLNACGHHRNSLIPQSKNHILDNSYETRSIIEVCNFAVEGAVTLQNGATRLNQSSPEGLSLLSNITTKWMQIPLQTPTYFFRLRPPVSSQIFSSKCDAKYGDGLSVCRGHHLSLNLCLQLRNAPPSLLSQLPKLYCFLSTSVAFHVQGPIGGETEQTESGLQDEMVDMNNKLFQYVMGREKTRTMPNTGGDGGCRNVEVFMCLETNVKGQGFSTCLLDVSAFPVGSYRIKWHSCCIDSQGSYWSLLPLNLGPLLTIHCSLSKTCNQVSAAELVQAVHEMFTAAGIRMEHGCGEAIPTKTTLTLQEQLKESQAPLLLEQEKSDMAPKEADSAKAAWQRHFCLSNKVDVTIVPFGHVLCRRCSSAVSRFPFCHLQVFKTVRICRPQ